MQMNEYKKKISVSTCGTGVVLTLVIIYVILITDSNKNHK